MTRAEHLLRLEKREGIKKAISLDGMLRVEDYRDQYVEALSGRHPIMHFGIEVSQSGW